jgi:hypothetical protein
LAVLAELAVKGGKENVNAVIVKNVQVARPNIGCHYVESGLCQCLGNAPAALNTDPAFGADAAGEHGYLQFAVFCSQFIVARQ